MKEAEPDVLQRQWNKRANGWGNGGRGIMPGTLLKLLAKDKLLHSGKVTRKNSSWDPWGETYSTWFPGLHFHSKSNECLRCVTGVEEITPEQSSLSLTTSLKLFITQMHTCKTIYTLVQHGMWRQAYPRNTDATCTVRWQTWWRRSLGSSLQLASLQLVPFEQWDRVGLCFASLRLSWRKQIWQKDTYQIWNHSEKKSRKLGRILQKSAL